MDMKRRKFLIDTAALSILAVANPSLAVTPTRKPNIIIVLADDLGFGDLGVYGARLIRTPHLDALAKNGVRFTNFFASANICSQSRAGLFTGRFAIRSGMANGVIQASDTVGLPPEEVTIAEMLKPDYATALIGKWHLGHVPPFWPPRVQGFDYFYGLPYSHNMVPLSLYTSGEGADLITGEVDYHRLTAQFFQRGIAYVEQNRDRPFFLTLALTAPHAPLDPNPDTHQHQSHAGDYGDVVEEIDLGLGRLVAKLRSLGLDRDTLIMVTSDNGPWFEGSSGDARDRKGGAGWDGGYKVPLIVSQPGRIPADKVRDQLAMNIDFLPTLAAWTGTPLPSRELDGRDISNVITSGGPSPHDDLLLFDNKEISGIRSTRWKLVKHSYYRGYKLDLGKYMISRQGALLFDVEEDPGELYSVASRYPDIFGALMRRMTEAQAKYDALAPRS
jgi:uncharacterized sulfatase